MAPEIEGLVEVEEIGRGGFGVVYRARQPAFDRLVAVKVFPWGRVTDDALARFERECRATGRLSGHRNIVTVYGSGVTGEGDPYLLMDYLGGGSLGDRVATIGVLTPQQTVALGVLLCDALATAHEAEIVHRDVKPENILFSDSGEPFLADFGIARMASAFETKSGSISATVPYAPPEVIGGQPATPASDVYSLAAVLHFSLAGRSPFQSGDDDEIAALIARIAAHPAPDLAEAGVPEPVAAAIRGGLSKIPAERPETAEGFAARLRDAADAAGLIAPTRPVPVVPPIPDGVNRVSAAPATSPVGSVRSAAASDPGTPPVAAPADAAAPRTRRPRALLVALIAGVLFAAGGGWLIASGLGDDGGGQVGPPETTTSTSTSSTSPTSTSPTSSTSSTSATSSTSTSSRSETSVVPPPPPPPPARPPGAVTAASAAYLRTNYIAERDQDPERITVRLDWRAPTDNGGAAVSEYSIRCTVMKEGDVYSGPYDSTTKGEPCRGAQVAQTGGTNIEMTIDRVDVAHGWIKWEVAARNRVGTGGYTVTDALVPDMVGRRTWEAYHMARAVGLESRSGGTANCGRGPDDVCSQDIAAGSRTAVRRIIHLVDQA